MTQRAGRQPIGRRGPALMMTDSWHSQSQEYKAHKRGKNKSTTKLIDRNMK